MNLPFQIEANQQVTGVEIDEDKRANVYAAHYRK